LNFCCSIALQHCDSYQLHLHILLWQHLIKIEWCCICSSQVMWHPSSIVRYLIVVIGSGFSVSLGKICFWVKNGEGEESCAWFDSVDLGVSNYSMVDGSIIINWMLWLSINSRNPWCIPLGPREAPMDWASLLRME
jgi:hypothetical protein